METNQSNIRI